MLSWDVYFRLPQEDRPFYSPTQWFVILILEVNMKMQIGTCTIDQKVLRNIIDRDGRR